MNAQSQIAAALASDMPLSSARCAELITIGRQHSQTVGQRITAIRREGKFFEPMGSERLRLLQVGTSTDIKALDAELESLNVEAEQSRIQLAALEERKQIALPREASEALPNLNADVVTALAGAERAREAFEHALAAVDEAYGKVWSARARTVHARLPAEPAAPKTAERIESLRPWAALTRHRVFAVTPDVLRDELGITEDRIAARRSKQESAVGVE